jgi:hypothetical protein
MFTWIKKWVSYLKLMHKPVVTYLWILINKSYLINLLFYMFKLKSRAY